MAEDVNVKMKVFGQKKLVRYLSQLNRHLERRERLSSRPNGPVKRTKPFQCRIELEQLPAGRARGWIRLRVKPSKGLLKRVAALGAGHLNRQWEH